VPWSCEPSTTGEWPYSRTKRRAFSTYSQYTVHISDSFTRRPVSRATSDSKNEVEQNDQQVPVSYCGTGGKWNAAANASGPAGFCTPRQSTRSETASSFFRSASAA